MPPRSKRKRVAPARTTRSKVQAPGVPSKPATSKTEKSTTDGPKDVPGPSTRRTRSNLIMEIVLPASKRPTPKTSSALTPLSPAPSATMQDAPELSGISPLEVSQPVRESTPQPAKQDKGKQREDSLPPSSPPPNSSPAQGFKWDHSSDPVFSTPSPSPSRSRLLSNQPSTHRPTPTVTTNPALTPPIRHSTSHPSSPHIDDHPDLSVVPYSDDSQHSLPPQGKREENPNKPPTSPAPYSDTLAPEDPFGFFAAENRLRERRAQLGLENSGLGPDMPSSGGPESFNQSVYEEAFASLFYDPPSGGRTGSEMGDPSANKSTTASLYDTDGNGNGNDKSKPKRTMEVVIPTRSKAKEKAKESKKGKGKEIAQEEAPAKPARGKGKGKEKAKEHVLTTYELEAMLPHRARRVRKRRPEEPEHIPLSDVEDDRSSSPKRRKTAPATKGKAVRGASAKTNNTKAGAGMSKDTKPMTRSTGRTRAGESAGMNDETRKLFEAERKRRLEAYKSLDKYTLEEEEVVW